MWSSNVLRDASLNSKDSESRGTSSLKVSIETGYSQLMFYRKEIEGKAKSAKGYLSATHNPTRNNRIIDKIK